MKRLLFGLIGLFVIAAIAASFIIPDFSIRVQRRIDGYVAKYTRPKNLFVPTPVPQKGGTALPTAQIATASATPAPTIAISLPPAITLSNIRHEYQTWNNCGPATLGMTLSYYNSSLKQAEIAPYLKPDPEDKNVSPTDVVEFINNHTEFKALYAVNGNMTVVKQLLAKNIPVMIETWFILHPDDEMGHYELTRGYNDSTQQFLMYDSYRGPNISTSYKDYDENWKVFDRTFIVIYQPKDEAVVKALLPGYFDTDTMLKASLLNAQAEVAADPNDKFALFNLGSTLHKMNRNEEAAVAYDKARALKLPWRMLWYQFGMMDAYLQVGRYDDVISLANANLAQANNLEESYYFRGQAYEKTGKTDEARRDYQKALQYNKNYTAAQQSLDNLK